jgi:hypothetical protein
MAERTFPCLFELIKHKSDIDSRMTFPSDIVTSMNEAGVTFEVIFTYKIILPDSKHENILRTMRSVMRERNKKKILYKYPKKAYHIQNTTIEYRPAAASDLPYAGKSSYVVPKINGSVEHFKIFSLPDNEAFRMREIVPISFEIVPDKTTDPVLFTECIKIGIKDNDGDDFFNKASHCSNQRQFNEVVLHFMSLNEKIKKGLLNIHLESSKEFIKSLPTRYKEKMTIVSCFYFDSDWCYDWTTKRALTFHLVHFASKSVRKLHELLLKDENTYSDSNRNFFVAHNYEILSSK